VKTFRLRQPVKYRPFWIRVTLFTFTTVLLSSWVFSGEAPKEQDANQTDEQIQIVADKLITNNAEKFAEFVGDVRASQGNLVITSERLRIYYKDNADRNEEQTGSQELIKRIVASGNVVVSSEKYKAETDRVEYTVNRKNGQIKVESSPQKRVKAVFYPKEKASNQNTKE
jgi:lipopolysaccharide export system protein LptA